MKLILRADLENLGRLGDLVDVRPGYGRNYLIPQGLAMLATKSNLKNFEQERKKLQAKMDTQKAMAQDIADKLIALDTLTVPMRVGENDKLYGSVTSGIIFEMLAEAEIEVDRKKIQMPEHIRALGEYFIEFKLHPDVRAQIRVHVIRQGGEVELEIEETLEEIDSEIQLLASEDLLDEQPAAEETNQE